MKPFSKQVEITQGQTFCVIVTHSIHFTEQVDPPGQRSQKPPKNVPKIRQNVTHKWIRLLTQKPCRKGQF